MLNSNKYSTETQAISTFEELKKQKQQKAKSIINIFLVILTVIVMLIGLYVVKNIIQQGKTIHYRFVGVPTEQAQQQLKQKIENLHQSHYLAADLMQIRDTALAQSWVDEVVVSRIWPNQILIKVVPRQAVARWGKSKRWVDEQGKIFDIYHAENFKNFVTLSGPSDQSKYIMQTYQEVDKLFRPMNLHLMNVHLTERMTWFFQFDNGLRIVVDQDNTMLKLQQLSKITQTKLKSVIDHIIGFDLRYRDGFAIQWKENKTIVVKDGRFLISSS